MKIRAASKIASWEIDNFVLLENVQKLQYLRSAVIDIQTKISQDAMTIGDAD